MDVRRLMSPYFPQGNTAQRSQPHLFYPHNSASTPSREYFPQAQESTEEGLCMLEDDEFSDFEEEDPTESVPSRLVHQAATRTDATSELVHALALLTGQYKLDSDHAKDLLLFQKLLEDHDKILVSLSAEVATLCSLVKTQYIASNLMNEGNCTNFVLMYQDVMKCVAQQTTELGIEDQWKNRKDKKLITNSQLGRWLIKINS
ncbi:hypothetical protein SERLADRAFT_404609 [Serpula lacrymans var. lacrymans S7.9]|uniref:Uncharacterized protein n=1 Tax=Serpula lacrymans var. lacrymans (strain S7.9) TaxID=578457 RepID=F8NDX1_SERL9|nr:uncharacterized protein SERLADRAFT_404609 [Serpula lacrymans var. lacrymans S7.9]EGO30445.1 hypothetical protein SERLADRAFT_404609 [Serpula lacrymans var. lacrymans S7.9]